MIHHYATQTIYVASPYLFIYLLYNLLIRVVSFVADRNRVFLHNNDVVFNFTIVKPGLVNC